jgi:hypothetical protein
VDLQSEAAAPLTARGLAQQAVGNRVTLTGEMRRLAVLLTVALTLVTLFAVADTAAGASSPRAKALKQRLKSFPSCERLIGYARSHVAREQRSGGSVVSPGPAPPATGGPVAEDGSGGAPQPGAAPTGEGRDSSGTNVQEVGVDEPDIVKSDGTHIFAVAAGRLHAVDARSPRLLGSLDLDGYAGELLLRGDRLLVISYASVAEPQPGPQSSSPEFAPDSYRLATLITEVDVSDPAAMKVVRTETVDGSYVSARQNGATARIVLSSTPIGLYDESVRGRARGWLPTSTLKTEATGATRTRRLTACRQVRRPRLFSGLNALTVLTVDMRKGLPAVDADALLTDAQTVYASHTGLFVATQRYLPPPDDASDKPPALTTAIHRFDISDAGETRYRASGQVTGYVLNQFALSEHEGVLRVASTDSPAWWPGEGREESQSYVTTLRQSGGALLALGRVGGLGRGEQIFGVRFVDETGYVVTFRQTDPLYTVDLSRPAEPRVAGELKILGYSAYLHPVGDGLLLGVGQDATEAGRRLGTQLSLFDVSDPARPTRLSQRRVGGSSSSEVEYDHHAFLYWAPEKLAVLPVSEYDGRGDPFLGAIGFTVGRARITELGRITHQSSGSYPAQLRRSVVVGERLFTISESGAKASALSSLADKAWVPFPAPPEQQSPPGGDPGQPQPADGPVVVDRPR